MLPTTVNAPKDSTDQNVRPAQIQENGTSAQINAYVQLQRLSGTDTNVFVIKICLEINAFLAQLQELGTPQRTNVFAHLQRLFSQAVIVNAQLAFTETTVFHALPQDTGMSTQSNAFVKILWSGMAPAAAALSLTSCTKETASNVQTDITGSITDAKNVIAHSLIFKCSVKITPESQAQQAAEFNTDANKTSNLPKTVRVVTCAFALHHLPWIVLHKHASENESMIFY
jgi:branched-subunit amino acid transport protein AzlD